MYAQVLIIQQHPSLDLKQWQEIYKNSFNSLYYNVLRNLYCVPILLTPPFQLIMKELRLADSHLAGLGVVCVSAPHSSKHVELLTYTACHGAKPAANIHN